MQKYDNDFNRATRISELPKNLIPQEIIESITDFEQSAPIISLLNSAVPEFFASKEFNKYSTEQRKEIVFSFRILMDALARIQEFERRTYQLGTDFWAVGVN